MCVCSREPVQTKKISVSFLMHFKEETAHTVGPFPTSVIWNTARVGQNHIIYAVLELLRWGHVHTHIYIYAHTHIYAHTRTHTHTYVYAHTHSHMHTFVITLLHTNTQKCAHIQTYIHARTHARTHMDIPATHTYIFTHYCCTGAIVGGRVLVPGVAGT